MFNIIPNYFSAFKNTPPASCVAHITIIYNKDFLTCVIPVRISFNTEKVWMTSHWIASTNNI